MSKIIDLSLPIEFNPFDSSYKNIERIEHRSGGDQVWKNVFFKKNNSLFRKIKNAIHFYRNKSLFNRSNFPDGMFLSNEFFTLSVHCGTHLDAPFHYGPLCEGKQSLFIHEIPLEWCYSAGVVLDLTHVKSGEVITLSDVASAVEKIGYQIKPFDIVFIRTDSDKLWPKMEYFTKHPGMSVEATAWLVEQGVKIIGIDTNGFDLPFMDMIGNFIKTKDQNVLWPCHMYGRKREYLQIERLANLDRLPVSHGFLVSCFPIAIRDAGAAWIRATAIIN